MTLYLLNIKSNKILTDEKIYLYVLSLQFIHVYIIVNNCLKIIHK